MKQKLLRAISLVATLALCVSAASFAGRLYVLNKWYASENTMYRQAAYPTIYNSVIGGGFLDAEFNSMVTVARNTWSRGVNGVGGMPSASTTSASNANIKVYGGPYDNMFSIDNNIRTDYLGYTNRLSVTNEGQWGYKASATSPNDWSGMVYKDGYKTYNTRIVIVHRSTSTFFKEGVVAHELGHAFGWVGHSSMSSDLMQPNGIGRPAITQRDLDHVKQVYDLVGYSNSIATQ